MLEALPNALRLGAWNSKNCFNVTLHWIRFRIRTPTNYNCSSCCPSRVGYSSEIILPLKEVPNGGRCSAMSARNNLKHCATCFPKVRVRCNEVFGLIGCGQGTVHIIWISTSYPRARVRGATEGRLGGSRMGTRRFVGWRHLSEWLEFV